MDYVQLMRDNVITPRDVDRGTGRLGYRGHAWMQPGGNGIRVLVVSRDSVGV